MKKLVSLRLYVLCLFFSLASTAMVSVLIHKGLPLQQDFKVMDADGWYTGVFGNPFRTSNLGQSNLWPLLANFVSYGSKNVPLVP